MRDSDTSGAAPPFTGVLDARGSAPLDLDLPLSPGMARATLFLVIGPAGSLTARAAVLEFDS